MKERKNSDVSLNRVLNDADLMVKIQSVIEDAVGKGYTKTPVMHALSQKWQDMNQDEKEKVYVITDEDMAFFEKIDKFYSDYGQAFVLRTSWRECGARWEDRKKIEEKAQSSRFQKRVLDSLKVATKSIYCIFRTGGSFTLKKIERFNRELFGCRFASFDAYVVDSAISDLYFYKSMPVYESYNFETERIYDQGYVFCIDNNASFCAFVEQHPCRNTLLNMAALKLIWIISTYY